MKTGRLFACVMLLMSIAVASSADPEDGPLGMYAGGGVGGVVQGNPVGEVFIGHSWDNFAVEGGLSYFKSKVDVGYEDFGREFNVDDSWRLRLAVAAKAGQSVGRVKPYMSFGIRYEVSKNNSDFQSRVKGDCVHVVPALGVDIRVADHPVSGFVVVSVPFTVVGERRVKGGSFGDSDFDDVEVDVLSSFSVAYLF